MKNRKIALIEKRESSYWVSCQSITENLKESWTSIQDSTTSVCTFDVPADANDYDFYQLAKKIKKEKIDSIVWIDHYPHPGPLFKALDIVFEDNLPEIIVHLFGDFVLNCRKWLSDSELLKKFKIKFITASEHQKQLVESFLVKNSGVYMAPFPVNGQDFYYSEELRNKWRGNRGLAPNQKAFVYTGRLSLQKNVIDVVKLFVEIQSTFPDESLLYIAGAMDDLSVPYVGKVGRLGSFYASWQGIWKKVVEYKLEDRITFLGNLDKSQLNDLYNGADCFISLSTHNDEDFGMSPAEAMSCGLPTILTDWGGYSSFKRAWSGVEFVPVEFDRERVVPSLVLAKKILMKDMLKPNLSSEERKDIAKKTGEYLELNNLKDRLNMITNGEDGIGPFNSLFSKLAGTFHLNQDAPFMGRNGEAISLYREIYKVYMGDK